MGFFCCVNNETLSDGSPRYPDTNPGDQNNPVGTADAAFQKLPESWSGTAEIRFAITNRPYPIAASEVYLGTPIGPAASSLVIRAGIHDDDSPYTQVAQVMAASGTSDEILVSGFAQEDISMGAVLGRLRSDGVVAGPVVSIRGNTASGTPPAPDSTMRLQRPLSSAVSRGERFAIERPAVTLAPQQGLTLISHDGRSPNLMLKGIRIAPRPGAGLTLLNVRAMCDTCEFYIEAARPATPAAPLVPVIFHVHSNSRIQGGIEGDASREQAGVYINSSHRVNIIRAVRGGALGGHLTFHNLIVQVSQGGWFIPKSLESNAAPIQILAGGNAIAELSRESNGTYTGWGTASNKARIRNVVSYDSQGQPDGDGLRLFNGGSLNSPVGPIHLDIYGCNRDGIRLEMGSFGCFGPPGRLDPDTGRLTGAATGLTTTDANNGQFGMNVRTASRALIGSDATEGRQLNGDLGAIALDDQPLGGWDAVVDRTARGVRSNEKLSLVCVNG